MVSQCTKFEVSRFTRYEAVNGSAKCVAAHDTRSTQNSESARLVVVVVVVLVLLLLMRPLVAGALRRVDVTLRGVDKKVDQNSSQ